MALRGQGLEGDRYALAANCRGTGLRARILEGGPIRIGDVVAALETVTGIA